ncbi:hypothetical protein E2C01_061277 [Portunus trituberculatus]|uniref:Uncharacterized protein n=1 Tax=Portunus trituberculatus TaxID=210409 RepID=A0A5B7H3F5_PORTR|nr:hypothetical protein [Portunus trituberculatus]
MAGTIIALSKYYSGVIIGRGLPSPASCHGLPLITISTTADADRRTDGGNFFRHTARPHREASPPVAGTSALYYSSAGGGGQSRAVHTG